MEEEGAIVVQSSDVSSSQEIEKRKTEIGSSVVPSRPSPYDVLINMPIYEVMADVNFGRWYTMKIHADAVDGTERSISKVWRRHPLQRNCTFALLGSDLYCLGGRCFEDKWAPSIISNVWKVNIRDPSPTDEWISVQPMISPRANPHTLVLGGKLYVLSGYPYYVPPTAWAGEVYDPITDSWQALPDTPCYLGYNIIYAALENPDRILVASIPDQDEDEALFLGRFANFFMYDVQNCSWKVLDPVCRKIHSKCPVGDRDIGLAKAVAVGNYLYWITYDVELLAYDFCSDLWLTGNLKGLNIEFLEYDEPRLPVFFNLENQRFCIIQRTLVRDPYGRRVPSGYVQCILFDVSPMPEKKNLRISIVSTINYKTPGLTSIRNGFLM